ncbi:nSTAND1 domain-containing NTPase [Streptomyces europaeiscabiei]|uniref:nSTAND1 domain-containing NTPase n=1 Tax=Streptomyces europaeiscabiei TaxID=146819 RepID=UPI0038F7DE1E
MAGRPEKRLEPDDGPVQRLAYELRLLREQAGSPTYRTMAQRVRFSVTTLAQAASGERMPSLQVLRAYVQACGADPDEWQVRWQQAVEESAATRDTAGTPPPYRGPALYEPEDRAFFFGRDRLVAELVALVTERRFAILSGASESGKSSLLRAGLVPALQETAGRLRPSALVRLLTPGEGPAAAYDRLLNPCPDEPEIWVVVDQFEEVFALCRNRAERNRFIDLLLAAREPDSRVRVVLAVRADYRGRCAEHPGLAQALRDSSLRIGPMSPAELREAVTGPAAAEGLLVERELTNRLACIAAGLSLASVLTFVSSASAVTDIMRAESFDANRVMLTLCNGPTWDTYWLINVQTGELKRRSYDQWKFDHVYSTLRHPWEMVRGYCSYPESASWTWTGAEQQTSDSLVNCSYRSTLSQNIQANGTTTSTTTNSVSVELGIDWTILEKVLSVSAGGSYSRSWSYAKASGWSVTTGITIPARRKGWLAKRPVMRTVRSNPVFHVKDYQWGRTRVNSWRGRGYNEIVSYGAYYDAVGNVLDSNGQPSGQIVARDQGVNSRADCG